VIESGHNSPTRHPARRGPSGRIRRGPLAPEELRLVASQSLPEQPRKDGRIYQRIPCARARLRKRASRPFREMCLHCTRRPPHAGTPLCNGSVSNSFVSWLHSNGGMLPESFRGDNGSGRDRAGHGACTPRTNRPDDGAAGNVWHPLPVHPKRNHKSHLPLLSI